MAQTNEFNNQQSELEARSPGQPTAIPSDNETPTPMSKPIPGQPTPSQLSGTGTTPMTTTPSFARIAKVSASAPISNTPAGTTTNGIPWNLPHREDRQFLGRTLELERVHQLLQTNLGGMVAIAGISGVGKTELAMQYAHQYRQQYPGGICWIEGRGKDPFTQLIQFVQQHVGIPPTQTEIEQSLSLADVVSEYAKQWRVPGVVLLIFDDIAHTHEIQALLDKLPQRFLSLLTLRHPGIEEEQPEPEKPVLPSEATPSKLKNLNAHDVNSRDINARDITSSATASNSTQKTTNKLVDETHQHIQLTPSFETAQDFEIIPDFEATEDFEAEDFTTENFEATEDETTGALDATDIQIDIHPPPADLIDFTAEETALDQLLMTVVDLDVLSREESAIWLSNLVGARVTTAQPAAKTLCKKVGYLPLAISLLGRYLANNTSLSVGEVSQTLTQEAQIIARQTLRRPSTAPVVFIDRPSSDLSLIEQGVEAIFELCWQQLGAPAQHLGKMLSLFAPGDIPISLVDSVAARVKLTGNVLTSAKEQACTQQFVQRLAQKGSGSQFRLHPLSQSFLLAKRVRQSGRKRTGQQRYGGTPDRWEQAYIIGLADYAETIDHGLTPQDLAKVAPAIPHLKAVLNDHLEQVPDQQIEALFGGITRFYSSQDIFEEAHHWAQRSHKTLCDRLGNNHRDIAKSLNNLAHVYTIQNRLSEAEALYTQALELSQKQLGEGHPDIANSLNNLANVYASQNRFQEAEALYLQTLEVTKKSLGEDHITMATGLNNLGLLYSNQDRFSESEALHLQALTITKNTLGENHPTVAKGCNSLANIYASQGRFAEAEPFYQQELAITRQSYGERHIAIANSLNNLALLYKSQNRFREAEPLYKQALDITVHNLGENHPMVAKNLNNLANVYSGQDRFREAEPLYTLAIDINNRTLGEDHPDVATSINNLALLYKTQCRFSEAEPLYLKALQICEQSFREDPAVVTKALSNLAEVYTQQGYFQEAEPLYKQALAIAERNPNSSEADVARCLNNLGQLYGEEGRFEEAESLCLQALEMNKRGLGKNHPTVAKSLNDLAFLYKEQGRLNEAEKMFAQALEVTKAAPENKDTIDAENSEVNIRFAYLKAFRRSRKRKRIVMIFRIIFLALFLSLLIPAMAMLVQGFSADRFAWLLFILFLGLTVWVVQALFFR
ncbi:MAG: tetratricopeptide repeat protein [Cyanobacteria bacterium P01_F01_bin.53]